MELIEFKRKRAPRTPVWQHALYAVLTVAAICGLAYGTYVYFTQQAFYELGQHVQGLAHDPALLDTNSHGPYLPVSGDAVAGSGGDARAIDQQGRTSLRDPAPPTGSTVQRLEPQPPPPQPPLQVTPQPAPTPAIPQAPPAARRVSRPSPPTLLSSCGAAVGLASGTEATQMNFGPVTSAPDPTLGLRHMSGVATEQPTSPCACNNGKQAAAATAVPPIKSVTPPSGDATPDGSTTRVTGASFAMPPPLSTPAAAPPSFAAAAAAAPQPAATNIDIPAGAMGGGNALILFGAMLAGGFLATIGTLLAAVYARGLLDSAYTLPDDANALPSKNDHRLETTPQLQPADATAMNADATHQQLEMPLPFSGVDSPSTAAYDRAGPLPMLQLHDGAHVGPWAGPPSPVRYSPGSSSGRFADENQPPSASTLQLMVVPASASDDSAEYLGHITAADAAPAPPANNDMASTSSRRAFADMAMPANSDADGASGCAAMPAAAAAADASAAPPPDAEDPSSDAAAAFATASSVTQPIPGTAPADGLPTPLFSVPLHDEAASQSKPPGIDASLERLSSPVPFASMLLSPMEPPSPFPGFPGFPAMHEGVPPQGAPPVAVMPAAQPVAEGANQAPASSADTVVGPSAKTPSTGGSNGSWGSSTAGDGGQLPRRRRLPLPPGSVPPAREAPSAAVGDTAGGTGASAGAASAEASPGDESSPRPSPWPFVYPSTEERAQYVSTPTASSSSSGVPAAAAGSGSGRAAATAAALAAAGGDGPHERPTNHIFDLACFDENGEELTPSPLSARAAAPTAPPLPRPAAAGSPPPSASIARTANNAPPAPQWRFVKQKAALRSVSRTSDIRTSDVLSASEGASTDSAGAIGATSPAIMTTPMWPPRPQMATAAIFTVSPDKGDPRVAAEALSVAVKLETPTASFMPGGRTGDRDVAGDADFTTPCVGIVNVLQAPRAQEPTDAEAAGWSVFKPMQGLWSELAGAARNEANTGPLLQARNEPGRDHAAVLAVGVHVVSELNRLAKEVELAAFAGDEVALLASQAKLHDAASQLVELQLEGGATAVACKALAFSPAVTPAAAADTPVLRAQAAPASAGEPLTGGTSGTSGGSNASWASIGSRVGHGADGGGHAINSSSLVGSDAAAMAIERTPVLRARGCGLRRRFPRPSPGSFSSRDGPSSPEPPSPSSSSILSELWAAAQQFTAATVGDSAWSRANPGATPEAGAAAAAPISVEVGSPPRAAAAATTVGSPTAWMEAPRAVPTYSAVKRYWCDSRSSAAPSEAFASAMRECLAAVAQRVNSLASRAGSAARLEAESARLEAQLSAWRERALAAEACLSATGTAESGPATSPEQPGVQLQLEALEPGHGDDSVLRVSISYAPLPTSDEASGSSGDDSVDLMEATAEPAAESAQTGDIHVDAQSLASTVIDSTQPGDEYLCEPEEDEAAEWVCVAAAGDVVAAAVEDAVEVLVCLTRSGEAPEPGAPGTEAVGAVPTPTSTAEQAAGAADKAAEWDSGAATEAASVIFRTLEAEVAAAADEELPHVSEVLQSPPSRASGSTANAGGSGPVGYFGSAFDSPRHLGPKPTSFSAPDDLATPPSSSGSYGGASPGGGGVLWSMDGAGSWVGRRPSCQMERWALSPTNLAGRLESASPSAELPLPAHQQAERSASGFVNGAQHEVTTARQESGGTPRSLWLPQLRPS